MIMISNICICVSRNSDNKVRFRIMTVKENQKSPHPESENHRKVEILPQILPKDDFFLRRKTQTKRIA